MRKKRLGPVFLFFVLDRSLLTLNMMGKERVQRSKMEIVINMLMLGRGAGRNSFYPSLSYQLVCVCVKGKYKDRDWARMKGKRNCAQHCMWVRGCTHMHTLTHTHCVLPSKQERTACERATFLFQSASGDSAKGLLLAHWWDKKRGRGGPGGPGGASDTRKASLFL